MNIYITMQTSTKACQSLKARKYQRNFSKKSTEGQKVVLSLVLFGLFIYIPSGSEDLSGALRFSFEQRRTKVFDNRHKKRDAGIDRTAKLRIAFMSPEVRVRLQHVASGSC